MTKLIGTETKTVFVTKEVICDDCGDNCLNTYIDILLKRSFAEDSELFKTVCYACYEKKYKDDFLRLKTKHLEAQMEYSGRERQY